jgi:hypothetical protein
VFIWGWSDLGRSHPGPDDRPNVSIRGSVMLLGLAQLKLSVLLGLGHEPRAGLLRADARPPSPMKGLLSRFLTINHLFKQILHSVYLI